MGTKRPSKPKKTKVPSAAFGAGVAKKGTGHLKTVKGKTHTAMGKG